ncbi:MAG: SCO family protein [Bradyrhizobium sp.]
MKRGAYILVFALVLLAGAMAAATALVAPSVSRPATPYADDLASLSFRPHPGAHLPLGAALVDELGRKVTLGRYFTKSPVILVLEYLHCTSLCGVTLRNLIGGTLRKLPFEPGRDYQLLAISIDPRDRPKDAAAAAATYRGLLNRSGGKAGLHFLVGASAAVRKIAGVVGFPYRYDKLLNAYIHPIGFIVASPDGLISRYFEGFSVSPSDLAAAFADAE